MRNITLLAIALTLMTTPMALAETGSIDPIEYVLQDNLQVVERDKFAGAFEEKIEVRGQPPRTDRWITGVSQASVTVFEPKEQATAAVVICPGGGYFGLSFDKEGTYVARWLCERGVAAGVLKYRVYRGKPLGTGPLEDAQFALRFMKHKLGIKNVGIMGFSAGGHLAASASNYTAGPDKSSPGTIGAHGSAPTFSVLVYPVISMDPDVTHGGSGRNLIGPSPSREQQTEMSIEKQVTKSTPPALLIHAADDGAVSFENSVQYFRACRKQGVPAEMHVYSSGGHGFGMWRDEDTIATWPTALQAWLTSQGVIK